jgi:hypothetical protein
LKSPVFALFATLAGMASFCQAQSARHAPLYQPMTLVAENSGGGSCKANGKDNTIGAIITVEKSHFRCTKTLQDPNDPRSVTMTWVQIELPRQPVKEQPSGASEKK